MTYRNVLYLKLKLKTFHLDLMLSTFWLNSISYERGSGEVVSFFFTRTLFDFISSFQEQLQVKRDKLADQLEEAKKLKQNIDKRSFTVLSMLRKYLSDQLLADYDKFIKTKARLIMETRQLNDKVALSEEQKTILKET